MTRAEMWVHTVRVARSKLHRCAACHRLDSGRRYCTQCGHQRNVG